MKRRLTALAVMLTFTLAVAAQCGGTDPSGSPWAPCPHHETRIHSSVAPAMKPWVCVG